MAIRVTNNEIWYKPRNRRGADIVAAANRAQSFAVAVAALDRLPLLMMGERRLPAKLDAVRHGAGAGSQFTARFVQILSARMSWISMPSRKPRASGLEKALAALWSGISVQRCTVHKHRNLLAHAPDRLHEEISADYTDMLYADTKQEIATKRKAFIGKGRLKCKAVADGLEERGDKLFTFTRFPKSQWKSIRTSHAIERLHEEFKRRIRTQTVPPSAETTAMLFWALLASGQITMRKVDGWQSLTEKPFDQTIDLAA